MASIGTLLPSTTQAASSNSAAGSSTSGSTPSSASNSLANEGTFLQLLVAQLKNQDPSQPMDGTTFVTQLAQFSTLEQELASRQDLDSISKDLTTTASAASGATGGAASGTAAAGATGTTSSGTTSTSGTSSTSGS